MAQPELRFQRALIEAARELGGEGIKMSNRFMVGVSDLLLQLPTWPTVMAEVKLVALPVCADAQIKVDLSPLQRHFLNDWQGAGAHAGLIIANRTTKLDRILCTREIETFPTRLEFEQRCVQRPRGTPLVNLLRAGLLMPLLAQGTTTPPRYLSSSVTTPTTIPKPSTVALSPA